MQVRVRQALYAVDVVVGGELARALRQVVGAPQVFYIPLFQGQILRDEAWMRLVPDAGLDVDVVNAVRNAIPLYQNRVRNFGRGERNQLVGTLQVVILERRLVDLARE